jgi:hypothetical protein
MQILTEKAGIAQLGTALPVFIDYIIPMQLRYEQPTSLGSRSGERIIIPSIGVNELPALLPLEDSR